MGIGPLFRGCGRAVSGDWPFIQGAWSRRQWGLALLVRGRGRAGSGDWPFFRGRGLSRQWGLALCSGGRGQAGSGDWPFVHGRVFWASRLQSCTVLQTQKGSKRFKRIENRNGVFALLVSRHCEGWCEGKALWHLTERRYRKFRLCFGVRSFYVGSVSKAGIQRFFS